MRLVAALTAACWLWLAAPGDANSLGLDVPACDAEDSRIWKPKDKGGKWMYWCTPPRHQPKAFSLRTGDGAPAADVSTYRPGGLVFVRAGVAEQTRCVCARARAGAIERMFGA